MSTAGVLGAGFGHRNKPQAPASTVQYAQSALAITLLVLSAFHATPCAAAEFSAGREVSITGDRKEQQATTHIWLRAPWRYKARSAAISLRSPGGS